MDIVQPFKSSSTNLVSFEMQDGMVLNELKARISTSRFERFATSAGREVIWLEERSRLFRRVSCPISGGT